MIQIPPHHHRLPRIGHPSLATKRISWSYITLGFLCLSLVWVLQCDKISPGVSGRITVGDDYLVADNAQQIVIALYRPADFDASLSLPKPTAKPLAHRILNTVHRPPYDYELEANYPSERVFVFAFLDQDNSGGLFPTHTDLAGVYPNNPVLLSEIRLFNVFIRLDRPYIRPPLRFEINRTLSINKPVAPQRLVVNLWRIQDIVSQLPKKNATPLSSQALTSFTEHSPWVVQVKVDHIFEEAIPFVFVDKDGRGGEYPDPGDSYATWKATPLPLQKAYTEKIDMVLDSTYVSSP